MHDGPVFTTTELPSVMVCGSSKFYPYVRQVSERLIARGLVVRTPRFDSGEETAAQVGRTEKVELTCEALENINQSDVIYVVTEGGYTGCSVCLEIGYASALGKSIILSEPATEVAIMALTDAVMPADQFLARIASWPRLPRWAVFNFRLPPEEANRLRALADDYRLAPEVLLRRWTIQRLRMRSPMDWGPSDEPPPPP